LFCFSIFFPSAPQGKTNPPTWKGSFVGVGVDPFDSTRGHPSLSLNPGKGGFQTENLLHLFFFFSVLFGKALTFFSPGLAPALLPFKPFFCKRTFPPPSFSLQIRGGCVHPPPSPNPKPPLFVPGAQTKTVFLFPALPPPPNPKPQPLPQTKNNPRLFPTRGLPGKKKNNNFSFNPNATNPGVAHNTGPGGPFLAGSGFSRRNGKFFAFYFSGLPSQFWGSSFFFFGSFAFDGNFFYNLLGA